MELFGVFYFVWHLMPALIVLGYALDKPGLFGLLLLLVFIVFALLDEIISRDKDNSYEEVLVMPENDGRPSPWIYQVTPISYLLFNGVAIGYGVYFAQFKDCLVSWLLYPPFFGVAGMVAISICHEYFHKNNWVEKTIARFFGSLEWWSVHEYDHLYYHHNPDIICTIKDFSYAKLNQSIYAYIFSSVIHNFKNAWEKQTELSREQEVWFYNIFKNPFLLWVSVSFVITVSIFIFVGWKGGLFFLLQAALAIFIFLSVTYTQHYGLTRRLKNDESVEDFTFMNVWCSDRFITNRIFNGSHHAHHHLFQLCRYRNLKLIQRGPLLPYGQIVNILISFVPPLWFKMMNPLVKQVLENRDQYEKEGIL